MCMTKPNIPTITNFDSNNIKAIDAFLSDYEKDHKNKYPNVTISKESRQKCVKSLVR